MSEEVYCTDCEHCMWIGDWKDIDCGNVYALPENGAPEVISCEPHNCHFFEPVVKVEVPKNLLWEIVVELRSLNGLNFYDSKYGDSKDAKLDFIDLIEKISVFYDDDE